METSNITGWDFVAHWDARERRIDARVYICGPARIMDAEQGVFERMHADGLVGEDDASDVALEDADEAFEEVMGFRPPEGTSAEFLEGDMFLSCYSDAEDADEGMDALRETLGVHGALVSLA